MLPDSQPRGLGLQCLLLYLQSEILQATFSAPEPGFPRIRPLPEFQEDGGKLASRVPQLQQHRSGLHSVAKCQESLRAPWRKVEVAGNSLDSDLWNCRLARESHLGSTPSQPELYAGMRSPVSRFLFHLSLPARLLACCRVGHGHDHHPHLIPLQLIERGSQDQEVPGGIQKSGALSLIHLESQEECSPLARRSACG